MTITFSNDQKTHISDPLRSLIFTEFKPISVAFEPTFNSAKMSHGEYIRYWILDSSEVSKFSKGETREYEVEIVFYFDTKRHRVKKAFDDVWSDRAEHLKRLLDNNSAYNDGTYRWHELQVSVSPVQAVSELEDIEDDTMAVRLLCLITRSNIRE